MSAGAWYRADVEEARRIGERMGFGALMQATETAWREKNAEPGGTPGSEHTTGPCAAMLVPCPARTVDEDGEERHYLCAWCCGSGRVTKRVARAIAEAGEGAKR